MSRMKLIVQKVRMNGLQWQIKMKPIEVKLCCKLLYSFLGRSEGFGSMLIYFGNPFNVSRKIWVTVTRCENRCEPQEVVLFRLCVSAEHKKRVLRLKDTGYQVMVGSRLLARQLPFLVVNLPERQYFCRGGNYFA